MLLKAVLAVGWEGRIFLTYKEKDFCFPIFLPTPWAEEIDDCSDTLATKAQ